MATNEDKTLTAARKKKAASRTPDEAQAVKDYNAAHQRWQRDKKKNLLPGSDDETLANRRSELEVTRLWDANKEKATAEELDAIDTWNNVNRIMKSALDILDQKETTDEDELFLLDVATDIDEYVRIHGVSKDELYIRVQNSSPAKAGFAEIQKRIKDKTLPPLASKFGVFADSVHATLYSHFLWRVRERRIQAARVQQSEAVAAPLTETEQRALAINKFKMDRESI